MYSHTISWGHAALLFLSLSSFQFGTATPIDNQLVERSGVASPGIGVEFESGSIYFTKDVHKLSEKEKEAVKEAGIDAKGKAVTLRTAKDGNGAKLSGKDWELTADATGGTVGHLPAEYILDGKKIKLGTGRLAIAAEEVYEDLKKWNPKSGQEVEIAGNKKNPWSLKVGTNPVNSAWSRQITSPMPLGAINDLIKQAKLNKPSPLMTYASSKIQNKVWVNDFFFEENPGGLTKAVGEDVRGFLSLILSYAKAGSQVRNSESAKELTSIMPRTSFSKMYKLIEKKLEKKDLWTIVNKLACYENPIDDAHEYAAVDERYCSGHPGQTTINGKFEKLQINICYGSQSCPVNVKAWIQGLKDGKDLLKDADKEMIDGQVGGYGDLTEHRLDHPTEQLPLFEFRDLPSCSASDWKKCLEKAETEIVNYHKKFPGN
ncbi:hypothetical protein CBS115989_6893 [Aspergillus niger]|uniref:Contig An09c0040, genomic contig n=3 Tax=Aspergillus niger TaxID=5061 RepID=A2QTB3_ASPNC|nr:uncharacterized protein An09g01480 [Aspergillus niger]RDH18976.1 hypothetical protein M747DRAFT_354042 [Aspergillus niger ATCC 13496]KAI2816392.1 hypothetical protein CBS115989_6893 [Aspergillus niger]KAI2841106.1 hypothetical protein CBS11350_6540 [Aspergillus niger]KAI2854726.1 hypothetical protein CBS11232_4813 [Aspergillus niger]KAI2862119.1 hypothetical protein CBS12448_4584 [Aspergillus niger]|eukprot:XP_001393465.1 hypothetical protein ANI_1_1080084 [Aspergillus niger CBS 513.88]